MSYAVVLGSKYSVLTPSVPQRQGLSANMVNTALADIVFCFQCYMIAQRRHHQHFLN